MSVACFSVGLCCFAYASGQARATSTLTTIFTAFTSFGLIAVSAWFASERYIYLRHQGRKWLGDALTEYSTMLMGLPGVPQIKAFVEQSNDRILQWSDSLQRLCAKLLCMTYARTSSSEDSDDIESGFVLPTAHANNVPPETPTSLLRRHSDATGEPPKSPSFSPASPVISENPTSVDPATSVPVSPGRHLWNNALRTVRMHSVMSMPAPRPREPRRRSTTSSTITGLGDRKKTMMVDEPGRAVSRSRVAALSPRLRELEPTQDVAAHSGLVRHLQFSPDGKYLATSRYVQTIALGFKMLHALLL
ncbi:hypothetical protein C0991_004753 [Blastosporella zonata]|nr:hypothetical protein C0991_004753 [Blastosporella zonata]